MGEATHKIISLNYSLHKDTAEGEMIESTEGQKPLVFLSGSGMMIPEFEQNVVNLAVGEGFSFGIKAENAYGEKREDAIMELPHDLFMQEGKLAEQVVIGNVLPMQDEQGNVHPVKVVSINIETVTVDANHLLAGQDLHFTGSILETREATAEEIEQGHVQGPEDQEA